jgi:hypothetical protein
MKTLDFIAIVVGVTISLYAIAGWWCYLTNGPDISIIIPKAPAAENLHLIYWAVTTVIGFLLSYLSFNDLMKRNRN